MTTGRVAKHYLLGGRLVAVKEGATLRFEHLEHLGSSSGSRWRVLGEYELTGILTA